MEETITFNAGTYTLEGLMQPGGGHHGIIIAHPHPLYGGDMYNHIVETIMQVYAAEQYATLRFNFRGTGRSQGVFDDGKGEQDDLRAAVNLLKTRGIDTVDVAGYSFGAWVAALAVSAGLKVRRLVMVSPPVAFVDFSQVTSLPPLHLVLCGDRDDFAPAGAVQNVMATWQPGAHFERIVGADHFYSGRLEILAGVLQEHL